MFLQATNMNKAKTSKQHKTEKITEKNISCILAGFLFLTIKSYLGSYKKYGHPLDCLKVEYNGRN